MMSSVRFDHPQEMHAAVGREVCVTDWVAIDRRASTSSPSRWCVVI